MVAGYICWLEESRHTPIRGILLIRDLAFAGVAMGLMVRIFYSGIIDPFTSFLIIAMFYTYYLAMSYFDVIEDFIMRLMGLKESNMFNSKFLLTSKNDIANFLEIQDIISEKP